MQVRRDLYTIAQSALLDGEIARDAHTFWGDRVEVRGRVGRNFHSLLSNRILLRDGARIEGDRLDRSASRYRSAAARRPHPAGAADLLRIRHSATPPDYDAGWPGHAFA